MFSQLTLRFLAFQTNASQTAPGDPNQNLNFWLVIAGILIIFICISTVFVPPIKDFLSKEQEFNLSKLGVSMKVSILTVFVLMGFVLSLSSFALQWRGYVEQARVSEQKVAELRGTIGQLEGQIRKMHQERTFDMSILLKPKMETDEVLNRDEWSCDYWVDVSGGPPAGPVHATIDRARNGRFLKVFLTGITPATRLYRVDLKKGNQTWAVENINPLTEGTWEAEQQEGGS